MAVLGYLTKLKRGLGLAFSANFLHGFSIQMFLINALSNDKVSVSYLFSFSIYQTKSGKSYLDNWKRHKL